MKQTLYTVVTCNLYTSNDIGEENLFDNEQVSKYKY